MAIRQSIRGLASSPPSLQRFRNAFTAISNTGDDRGYQWFASIHALPNPIWCHHGDLLFLPWHRAYLYYFELALQGRLGPRFTVFDATDPERANVGLPWWDWSSDDSHAEGIPSAYSAQQVGGEDNVLASARFASCTGGDPVSIGVWSSFLIEAVRQHQNPAMRGAMTATGDPRTRRDPDAPDELPRASSVEDFVFDAATFEDLSSSLEGFHNDVHGWVGGSMSIVPTSGYDPIFYAHHAMVDRLWAIWQNGPRGQDPPAALLNEVLTPFPLTVAQVLSIEELDYEYAVQAID